MKVGVYFYPWYNSRKWAEAPTRNTPLIGKYDSADRDVIKWQMDLIQWCGFDYVLFEVVPLLDWCFSHVARSIETALIYLKSINLKWSFLSDGRLVPQGEDVMGELAGITCLVKSRGWDEGLIAGPTGKPLLFSYRPTPRNARTLAAQFSDYELRFPIWFPHWGFVDEQLSHQRYAPFVEEALAKGQTVFDSLVPEGYVSFWECAKVTNIFDGFCSVAPGFDDTPLLRDPQWLPVLDRDEGRTLASQIDSSLKYGPDNVLVYSWNEYFETSEIEPTREYGMKYVELTRDKILTAKDRERS